MKYRLYGKDGITKHEWLKLIQWGIITKGLKDYDKKTTRVRKRVIKTRLNKVSNIEENYSDYKSGENDSAFTER